MTGFVTLAVGNEQYYKLAANLLQSYKLNGNCDAPFAIFADRKNKYTDLFDKVIILDHPHLSYLDKLEMLSMPPYEHNIFIDADCLIYNDVSLLIQYSNLNGVRCFGKALELSSTDGWFLIDDIGEYKHQVKFIPSMHGGIIYFASDSLTRDVYDLALKISSNYAAYRFKHFEKPADEPILALSLAVNNCAPIELDKAQAGRAFCFLPTVKKIKMHIRKKLLIYTTNDHDYTYKETIVLHWQNCMTTKPIYNREVDRMSMGDAKAEWRFILRWIKYHVLTIFSRSLRFFERCKCFLFDIKTHNYSK